MVLAIALFGLGFWLWLYAAPIYARLHRGRRRDATVAPSDANDTSAEGLARQARVVAGRRLLRVVAVALWIAGGLIAWLGSRA